MKNNNVLGLDIGGTNCRIGIIKEDKIIQKKSVSTADVLNLKDFVKKFLDENDNYEIKKAGIGFAGPIIEGKSELTNGNLKIDKKKLEKKLDLKIKLVNDFHALAKGIKVLNKKDILNIKKPEFENKIELIVGPGTGLGKAYIIDGEVYPAEGGQTLIGVENIHDYNLIDFLKKEYDSQVYYEDIISGRGIVDLYSHLAIKTSSKRDHKKGVEIKNKIVKSAEMVTTYCKNDELCDLTLKEFTKYYARFVRDSALHLIPHKIYLTGGISPFIKNYIKKYFIKEFVRHRSYTDLLKKIGVYVIINSDVGLLGAGSLVQ